MEFRDEKGNIIAVCTFEGGCDCYKGDGEPAFEDCVNCPSLKFCDDKVEVSDVYFIPDTSWYKPVEIKNSPRKYDEYQRKRKNLGWLPKRIRKHPKMQRIFGKIKEKAKKKRRSTTTNKGFAKTSGKLFDHLVEKAYKHGKI